jgi:hypothetical protein
MKKMLRHIVYAVVFPLFLCASCASVGKVRLSQDASPVALVNITAFDKIRANNAWKDEGYDIPDTTKPGFFQKRAIKKDPDLTVATTGSEVIDRVEQGVREALNGGKITLADKNTVINSQAYKDAKISRNFAAGKVAPEGYRIINYRDKQFLSDFSKETGIDRALFLEFTFARDPATGLGMTYGSMRIEATMQVLIKTGAGKTLFQRTYTDQSGDTIMVKGGAYSSSGALNLLDDAVANVCEDFLADIE